MLRRELVHSDVTASYAVQFHCERGGGVIDSENDDAAIWDARFRALRVQMRLIAVQLAHVHVREPRVQNFAADQFLVQSRHPETLQSNFITYFFQF